MRKSLRLSIILLALGLLVTVLTSCSEMQGEIDANQRPTVSFVNVHDNSHSIVYDYAPEIFWHGSDPDGFVAYYSYADITDSGAIIDPIGYIDQIPDEVWKDTIATAARVFLLSEAGETTEHVFYIRCVDNEGALSEVKYRTFFRTNRPPNVPRIGLSGEDEQNYSTRRVLTSDTLFSAPELSYVHEGIGFSWRGSDPDDKTMYKIPLEYQAILVKSPSDTVFVRRWSDATDITLVNLETGNYTLNVWSRDDGYTLSVNPARVEFYVIRPTFEHNLLVIMEASSTPPAGSMPPTSEIQDYYLQLLEDIAQDIQKAELTFDGLDVRFHTVNNFAFGAGSVVPSRALLSQYKVVIYLQDQFRLNTFPLDYVNHKVGLLEDYLSVGGRAWLCGRMTGYAALHYSTNADARDVMERFFGVTNIVGPASWAGGGGRALAEFIGTRKGIATFPDHQFDTTKAVYNWINPPGYAPGARGLSGVERLERNEYAQTTQYLYSRTAGTTVDVIGDEAEDCTVLQRVQFGSVNYDYPPTQFACYLRTANQNVEQVHSVINRTLLDAGAPNGVGEVVFINNDVIFVAYDEGQPWNDNHVLEVEYTYNPLSAYHLKPCAVRLEGADSDGVFTNLRFRSALTTYSPFYLEYEGAVQEWTQMLNWFFNPELNSFTIITIP